MRSVARLYLCTASRGGRAIALVPHAGALHTEPVGGLSIQRIPTLTRLTAAEQQSDFDALLGAFDCCSDSPAFRISGIGWIVVSSAISSLFSLFEALSGLSAVL